MDGRASDRRFSRNLESRGVKLFGCFLSANGWVKSGPSANSTFSVFSACRASGDWMFCLLKSRHGGLKKPLNISRTDDAYIEPETQIFWGIKDPQRILPSETNYEPIQHSIHGQRGSSWSLDISDVMFERETHTFEFPHTTPSITTQFPKHCVFFFKPPR